MVLPRCLDISGKGGESVNEQKKTTFTFSRLKQQKRQFSSNDQFDTLAGLQSVDPKEEAKFNCVCKKGNLEKKEKRPVL